MIEPARVVIDKSVWDALWQHYRTLIGGTTEMLLSERDRYRTMQDFERLRGDLEDGKFGYREFQIDRIFAIDGRRNATVQKEPTDGR